MKSALFRLALVVTLGALAPLSASAQGANVALGRAYTLTPRPNYSLTTDGGDDMQLTDGVYTTNNPIWTRTSTVGWTNASPVTIVVDLQTIQPIAGVSYSTAAGSAGVQWPRSIFVLTSDDGVRYFPAADLAVIPSGQATPPTSGYAAFRFTNSGLRTHGRYVAFLVDATGPYTFCDEITVVRGDVNTVTPFTGEPITDLRTYFVAAHMRVSVQHRLSADIEDARAALAASPHLDDALRARLTNTIDHAADEVSALPAPEPAAFKAVLPLTDLHASIFAVRGALAHADGLPPLSAWAVNPWDFVRPVDRPSSENGGNVVQVAAISGETRAGAVNFANSTEEPATVTLRVTNSGSGAPAGDVRLFAVAWTDTRDLIPVADALLPLPRDGATLDVPAGMTKQVWISVTPQNRSPGIHRLVLEARVADVVVAQVPIELSVLVGTFSDRPALHLGGWDYTDRQNYPGITPANSAALVAELRSLHVDSPWATGAVVPWGMFDSLGRLVQMPDTSTFDRWVANWPDARQYMIFVNVRSAIGAIPVGSAAFPSAVAQWIRFWTDHAAQKGIQPAQLMLLLVDEPATTAQDDLASAWATAIKGAQPDVVIWEDPAYPTPALAPPKLLDLADTVALARALLTKMGTPFVDFYKNWASGTRVLNVYGSLGPARLLDPYAYDRLQAWICADLGATGSFFWSFSDDAGGASWNEYRTAQTVYSPFFLSNDQVVISKHSEAIREGVEDFEYLVMAVSRDPALAGAAIDAVLRAPAATDVQWATVKDRSVADRMRLSIADALGLLVRTVANAEPPAPAVPPAVPAVTIAAEAVSFDGAPHPAVAHVSGADGSTVAGTTRISYEPGDMQPPVNAGVYAVTAVFTSADAKYTDVTATSTLTIQPAAPAIAINATAAVFNGGATVNATARVTGAGGGAVAGSVKISYVPRDDTPEGIDYVVSVVFKSADPNYTDAVGMQIVSSLR